MKRKDFPLLRGKIVYLDSAATSQKPKSVIDAISNYYTRYNANIHRGVYKISEAATEAYENAHKRVAEFINAADWREIIFVRNATEAINLVAYSWADANVNEGDEIVTTRMEHHSNLVPWQAVARRKKATLKYIEIDERGDLMDAKSVITNKTKLVALTHVSNVLGTVNDVAAVVRTAHEKGALVLVDGAQAVPHMAVDVRALDADFYVFSGHKMLGPTGIGVLYARRALLEKMSPFLYGGDMISRVTYDGAEWNELPWKFEAGTPNIAGGVGLTAAIDYLEKVGMEKIRAHEERLVEYAIKQLTRVEGVTIFGNPRKRGGVVSFNVEGIHPHDLASILDDEQIAVRAGHHCAQPLMGHMGIGSCARASFYLYNEKGDVDALVAAIKKAKKVMKV